MAKGMYPAIVRGLMAQESGCNPRINSHVGAKGLMQFMDPTARWVGELLGRPFNPYNPAQAIDAGTYYLWKQCSMFRRRGRTDVEACELGMANYNGGARRTLSAQKRCGNGRLFDEIAPCLVKETRDYVPHIRRRTREMEAARPWNIPPEWRVPQTVLKHSVTLSASPASEQLCIQMPAKCIAYAFLQCEVRGKPNWCGQCVATEEGGAL